MLRLLFLSTISGVVLTSGCSDDCGPGDAPDFGLVAGDADFTLTFGNLKAGANNDCPDAAAPAGVVSLTLSGAQMDSSGLITLCVPRPDQLVGGVPLGTGVRIIDLNGELNGCTFAFESARPVTGNASATGICDNGTNAAGFALHVDGNLSLRRTCTTGTDTLAVNFVGIVAVKPQ